MGVLTLCFVGVAGTLFASSHPDCKNKIVDDPLCLRPAKWPGEPSGHCSVMPCTFDCVGRFVNHEGGAKKVAGNLRAVGGLTKYICIQSQVCVSIILTGSDCLGLGCTLGGVGACGLCTASRVETTQEVPTLGGCEEGS